MLLERTLERAVEAPGTDGIFTSILASEGEASDGHILSIRGLQTYPELPMLFGHYSSEQIPLVGTIRKPTKSFKAPAVVRVEGQININGDGVLSEIRRGLWQLVQDGDLKAMSARAEALKVTPRRNLGKDHPAFIDETKIDGNDARRFGQFIERSKMIEGSLVAIGADPKALIGRADEAGNDAVKVFFRACSASVESDEKGLGQLGDAFTALRSCIDDVKELGVDDDELAEYLATQQARGYINYHYVAEDGTPQVARVEPGAFRALCGESRDAYKGALALHADYERKLLSASKPAPIKRDAEPSKPIYDEAIRSLRKENRDFQEEIASTLRAVTGRLS